MASISKLKELKDIDSKLSTESGSGSAYVSSDQKRLNNGDSIFRIDADKRAQNSSSGESNSSSGDYESYFKKGDNAFQKLFKAKSASNAAGENSRQVDANITETGESVGSEAANAVKTLKGNNAQINSLINKQVKEEDKIKDEEDKLVRAEEARDKAQEKQEQAEESAESNPFAAASGGAYSFTLAGEAENNDSRRESLLSSGAKSKQFTHETNGTSEEAQSEVNNAQQDVETATANINKSTATAASIGSKTNSYVNQNKAIQADFKNTQKNSGNDIQSGAISAKNDEKTEIAVTATTTSVDGTGKVLTIVGDGLAKNDKTKPVGEKLKYTGTGLSGTAGTTETVNSARKGDTVGALSNAFNTGGVVASASVPVDNESKKGEDAAKKVDKKPATPEMSSC